MDLRHVSRSLPIVVDHWIPSPHTEAVPSPLVENSVGKQWIVGITAERATKCGGDDDVLDVYFVTICPSAPPPTTPANTPITTGTRDGVTRRRNCRLVNLSILPIRQFPPPFDAASDPPTGQFTPSPLPNITEHDVRENPTVGEQHVEFGGA
jgi:hypothetical protein